MDNTTQIRDCYYRVSVKALIFDTNKRLLVFMDKNHEWEVPGGGWEHDETLEQCVVRELAEEVGVVVKSVSAIRFCYKGHARNGAIKLSITVEAEIDGQPAKPYGDDLIEAKFVTKDEFLQLHFQHGEGTVKAYADQIWPENQTLGTEKD